MVCLNVGAREKRGVRAQHWVALQHLFGAAIQKLNPKNRNCSMCGAVLHWAR